MDYLTVPVIPSASQMEKPLTKEELAVFGAPTSQTSSLSSPEGSNATAIISGIVPSKKKYTKGQSAKWSKHSTQPQKMKQEGKPQRRHRRKRKRRHRSLKESITRKWAQIKPYLLYLRKIIQNLTQSFLFDLFIFTVVGINTILLVAQTFAVVEIRGGLYGCGEEEELYVTKSSSKKGQD